MIGSVHAAADGLVGVVGSKIESEGETGDGLVGTFGSALDVGVEGEEGRHIQIPDPHRAPHDAGWPLRMLFELPHQPLHVSITKYQTRPRCTE